MFMFTIVFTAKETSAAYLSGGSVNVFSCLLFGQQQTVPDNVSTVVQIQVFRIFRTSQNWLLVTTSFLLP